MMSAFDYRELMGRLSDRGFEYCKSLLYPMLDFQCLTETEVRKIDLCEKMYDLVNRVPMKAGQKKDMAMDAFFDFILSFIQNTVKCNTGSVALEYKKRGLQIAKDLKDKTITDEKERFDQRLTLFAIYLALTRASYPDFSKKPISDACLRTSDSDIEILGSIKNYKQKKDLPGLFKKQEDQLINGNDVIYIHSVILHSILMEIQGEYERRDLNGSMG